MSQLYWLHLVKEAFDEEHTHPFYEHSSINTIFVFMFTLTCHNQTKIPLFAALNADVIDKQPKWRVIALDHIVDENTAYIYGHDIIISQLLSSVVTPVLIIASVSVIYKNKSVKSKNSLADSTHDVAHSHNVTCDFLDTHIHKLMSKWQYCLYCWY